jgi:hypothetical protein
MPKMTQGLGTVLSICQTSLKVHMRLSLRTLINLCSLQAISVREMLLDPRGAASAPLLDLWNSFVPLPLSHGFAHKKAHAFATSLRRLLRTYNGPCLPPMQEVLRATRLTCGQARDLRPEIYERYKAAYKSQDKGRKQAHARRALRIAMRLLQARETQRTVPADRCGFVATIADRAKVPMESAREALNAARHVRKILRHARVLLNRSHPPVLDHPAWTRGFFQPSNH